MFHDHSAGILNALERIANSLEKLVDQHETRPNIIQYLQTNVDALQCPESHPSGYVKGQLAKRCQMVAGHDMEFGHMDEDGYRWGNDLVAKGT